MPRSVHIGFYIMIIPSKEHLKLTFWVQEALRYRHLIPTKSLKCVICWVSLTKSHQFFPSCECGLAWSQSCTHQAAEKTHFLIFNQKRKRKKELLTMTYTFTWHMIVFFYHLCSISLGMLNYQFPNLKCIFTVEKLFSKGTFIYYLDFFSYVISSL